jgi:hypothetical protein
MAKGKNKRNRKGRRRGVKSESDAIAVRGQIEFELATAASGNGLLSGGASVFTITPIALGGSLAVAASIFSRYRFTSLRLRYVPKVGSTTGGSLAIGVLDDDGVVTSENLTTYFATVQLRRSTESQIWSRTTLEWLPVDRSKWYYTENESSTSDSRFVSQLAIVVNSNGIAPSLSIGTLVIEYMVVYAGAVPSATS